MPKIVAISDSHNQHRFIKIPECDLLIHSGDFSYIGKMQDILEINKWFGELKKTGIVKEIIAICGNHDFIGEQNPNWIKEAFTNCIYLNEESYEIFGFKIFGSPITPSFGQWAFMRDRGEEIARNWSKIPDDTEILITHGSPYGILDEVDRGIVNGMEMSREHVGCEELRKRVEELKNLKLHCFGHLHDNNEQYRDPSGKIFVNAAICNEQYQPIQPPQVILL